jgi:cysteine desulfurase
MLPHLNAAFGNAGSQHALGRPAREAVRAARTKICAAIGCTDSELVITGSGTEADNQAILGMFPPVPTPGDHLVISAVEHPAVAKPAEYLEALGVRVTRVAVQKDGTVAPADFEAALMPQTRLASVMLANNETGAVNPVRELAEIARAKGVAFHTDAVNAIGKLVVNVRDLGVDLLSAAAHKFHGPKGIGFLYISAALTASGKGGPRPLILGGGQEHGMRSGTEAVPAIVGLGEAMALAGRSVSDAGGAGSRMRALARTLLAGIQTIEPRARLNVPDVESRLLPNTLSLYFPGRDAQALMVALDLRGVCVSTGSACHAGTHEPSPVLSAMGLAEESMGSLRISLSRYTTDDEIARTLDVFKVVLAK